MPSKPAPTRFEDHPMARQIMRQAVAGTTYVVERKGDRVVGRLELADGFGPLGARHFDVDIRVPKSRDWTDERRAAAARVAACWARCIGNLDRIDKPLIGHIIQRLKQYTEVELFRQAWNRASGRGI